MIPAGEGDRYVFGTQVASIMANARSIGDSLEIVLLCGGRGDHFPLHSHEQASEAIYVLDGKLEVQIGTQKRLLTTGDYAHIPAGIPHAYKMLAHRTRFYSVTIGGEVSDFYRKIGESYERHERPHLPQDALTSEKWGEAAEGLDIRFVDVSSVAVEIPLVDNGTVPDRVVPYILENGDGDHTLSGDQVHSFLSTQAATGGGYIVLMSSGPKGQPIGEHYHEITNETFFCIQGSMTLWVDGEELSLQPGDFVYVPAGVKHKFRMDSHYTKFMGVLTPGSFEGFFRILGDPYAYPIFPTEPAPYRFDRVIQRIAELDLKVTGRPPGVPGPADGKHESA
ncbi:quercetin 2,3-dioxygenase [Cohnella candidum]|nr:quercetin 2,3-dioxygenase [Cohnella candidum]